MSDPSKNANLLNALVEMQESPAYAVRKTTLLNAEHCIVSQERELAAARQRIAELESKLADEKKWCGVFKEIADNEQQRNADLTSRLEAAEKDGARLDFFDAYIRANPELGCYVNSEDATLQIGPLERWYSRNIRDAIDAAILAQGRAK